MLLVAFAGCGNSDRNQLVGTWSIDHRIGQLPGGDELAADSTAADIDEEAQSGIRLYFYRSGRLRTETRQGNIATQKDGTWRWVSYDAEKKIAMIECELLDQRTEHRVTFNDDGSIRLIPPNLAGLPNEYTFERSR